MATVKHCDHLAHSGPGWKTCTRCGATCERDKHGVIVVYERSPLPRQQADFTEGR